MNQEPILINEVGFNERIDKRRTPLDLDLLTELLIQLGDFLHDIFFNNRGIVPVGPFQSRRNDILGTLFNLSATPSSLFFNLDW